MLSHLSNKKRNTNTTVFQETESLSPNISTGNEEEEVVTRYDKEVYLKKVYYQLNEDGVLLEKNLKSQWRMVL